MEALPNKAQAVRAGCEPYGQVTVCSHDGYAAVCLFSVLIERVGDMEHNI